MTRTEIEYIKDQIKQVLSLKDIVEFYVGQPNSYTGRYKCPFNREEHHCNLEVKDKYWRCYSCGTSGDEIEFVKRLFGLDNYKECLLKIAQDFGLKTTTQYDPAYEKKLKAIKLQREMERQAVEEYERNEKGIFNKICDRQFQLEKVIQKYSPYNPQKLDKYALTTSCDYCMRANYQYTKNNIILDILTCYDISDYDSAIFGYAFTPEEKIDLKKKVVRDIINKKIIINSKGDLVSAYGYKI